MENHHFPMAFPIGFLWVPSPPGHARALQRSQDADGPALAADPDGGTLDDLDQSWV